ncbi:MAG: phospholipid/cholesterol/gamma-HCH transport system substrate-binding protein [Solirubrobacterales bacterium]|jgi:virulence factor Mce-like protein|nr:phospholipid/cholesterol/gamma-HCH transport system substrate-binding protein [Solirubrobacterales bacterium]
MNGRARVGSLAASPTMVGAITTLIVIVAVFLAYNANNGLPFVPTYQVSAEICDAARLGPNNEVRIGGNRVGVVQSIDTVQAPPNSGCQTADGSSASTVAKLGLKLDKSAEPLPADSTIRIRYRSSFGLKYLEITRGTSQSGLPAGAVLPLAQSNPQVEFDDVYNTFDTATRENSQRTLQGFGDAFAARGASLNEAIGALNPLFTNLKPVSAALADPTTQLVRFFPELADAARIVAPVAVDNAEQFTNGAIAFGAISSDPQALRDTISNGPPALEAGLRSLPVQRPFLADFAEFSRLLRPGVRDLRAALPTLNKAVALGAKVLPRTVPMNNELKDVMSSLNDLVADPSTLSSLNQLGDTFNLIQDAGQKIVPAQTVCNYWDYWMTYLTSHFELPTPFGYAERVIPPAIVGSNTPSTPPRNPMDNYSGGQGDGRLSDLASTPGVFDALPANDGNPADTTAVPILHGNPYGPALTNGQPNCQAGQTGYALGEALIPGQNKNNPTFGVQNVTKAAGVPSLGRTDLFLEQNGNRLFWDAAHNPPNNP